MAIEKDDFWSEFNPGLLDEKRHSIGWKFAINFKRKEIKIINREKESVPFPFNWKKITTLSSGVFYKKAIDCFEIGTKEEKQQLRKAIRKLEQYLYDSKEVLTNEDFNPPEDVNVSNRALEEILSLEDWIEDKQIGIKIPIIKDENGIKRRFLFKSYVNESNECVIKNISEEYFPDMDSAPTEYCLQQLNENQKPIINYNEILYSLKKKLKKHSYHTDERVYDILATWIMSTYFRELFRVFGYIDIASPTHGYGKTITMKLIVAPCYYGIFFENPTEAVLFRLVDETKCVVGIDEFDKKLRNPKENGNLIDYVLSSSTYGIKTPRMDMSTDPPTIKFYDGFGGKVLTRLKYSDMQLLDRSIKISMEKADGRVEDIPEEFNIYEYFNHERDLCYLMRLFEHQEIKNLISVVKEELTKEKIFDRLADKYLQPLVIAKFLNEEMAFQNIISYAKEQEKEMEQEILDSEFSKLLLVIMKRKEWKDNWILNNNITNAYNEFLVEIGELKKDKYDEIKNPTTPMEVAESVKSLGFKNKRTNKGRLFHISTKRIQTLYTIYLKRINDEEIYEIYPECRHNRHNHHMDEFSDSSDGSDGGDSSDSSGSTTDNTIEDNSNEKLSDTERIINFIKSKSNEDCNYKIIHQALSDISGLTSKLELLRRDGIIAEIKGNWRFI